MSTSQTDGPLSGAPPDPPASTEPWKTIFETSMKIVKNTTLTRSLGQQMSIICISLRKNTALGNLDRAGAALLMGLDGSLSSETRSGSLQEVIDLCNEAPEDDDTKKTKWMVTKARQALKKLSSAGGAARRNVVKKSSKVQMSPRDNDGGNHDNAKAPENEEEEENSETSALSASVESDKESLKELDGADRSSVIKGKPEPEKLTIRIPDKEYPSDRSKDRLIVYKQKDTVNWKDPNCITAINRWRSQVFRRNTSSLVRKQTLALEEIERRFLVTHFEENPKASMEAVTKAFNAKFAGQQLAGCKTGPRPARTELAIGSECARNPQIRNARGKGARKITQRMQELNDVAATNRAKREKAKAAKIRTPKQVSDEDDPDGGHAEDESMLDEPAEQGEEETRSADEGE